VPNARDNSAVTRPTAAVSTLSLISTAISIPLTSEILTNKTANMYAIRFMAYNSARKITKLF
jgi:hypothetical protein